MTVTDAIRRFNEPIIERGPYFGLTVYDLTVEELEDLISTRTRGKHYDEPIVKSAKARLNFLLRSCTK